MTRVEWDQQASEHLCPHCKARGQWVVHPPQEGSPHGEKVSCLACGIFLRWLSKDRADVRRPKLKAGTIPQVWAAWGNCCASCGIPADDLALLGVGRTVQHAPPYDLVGDSGQLLPFCQWCQAQATSEMIKLRALVARIKERREHAR